jgi:3-deoxy-D-manno-octulosonate 8-phosphate phosphatase (KDO 8-P phosphatase)
MAGLEKQFRDLGGEFFLPRKDLKKRLKEIKAFIFDWDGVFNDGTKYGDQGSPFSEADSMGTNLLRFNHWLWTGKMPLAVIITGANNQSALKFAEREHFQHVYLNYKDKQVAFEDLLKTHNLKAKETAFFFDDVLDLGLAAQCGLRLAVRRKASPLFSSYLQENGLADYLSGLEGGRHAIREISELLIGLSGNYDQVLEKRIVFKGDYETYWTERQVLQTVIKVY